MQQAHTSKFTIETGLANLIRIWLSNVVENDIFRKTAYVELVKKDNAIQTIDTSVLVKKAGYNVKTKDIEGRFPSHSVCITTNSFNKFLGTMFDERSKQAKLATNSLVTVEQHDNENKEKIENLQMFDLSYFLDKTFFEDDGFQNIFVFNQHLVCWI